MGRVALGSLAPIDCLTATALTAMSVPPGQRHE